MPEMSIDQAFEHAVRAMDEGRPQQAEHIARQIISHMPNHAPSLHLLGIRAFQSGRGEEAESLISRALQITPDDPQMLNSMGVIWTSRGGHAQAADAFRRSAELQTGNLPALLNLGSALLELKRNDEAIDCYRRVIAAKPEFVEAHYNLGNAFRATGRFMDAIEAYERAIELYPAHLNATNNLATTLQQAGLLDRAINVHERAVQLQPDSPEAHWGLAYALLLRGDYDRAWREFEFRSGLAPALPFRRSLESPRWNGEPLDGKTIVLLAEQGFGDTIQFARFVPKVIERGGHVIVECQAELERLLRQSIAGIADFVIAGQPLPRHDLHCPLMSLPLALASGGDTFAASVPYLRADDADVAKWRERNSSVAARLKVGIVWSGSARHPNDANRSILLEKFAPFAQLDGVRLFNLQKESAPRWSAKPQAMEMIDFTSDLKDFADTAALIANLDLVITVDTSVAHLCGALGKPTWVLLPFAPDWRWMLGRDDSAWYPSMKLFRQSKPGEWEDVIARVADALRNL